MNVKPSSSILIATRNHGKLREFQTMFAALPFQLYSLDDFPTVIDVEEVGKSFNDNAVLKAIGYAGQTGLVTLADDSGLEVDSLNGAPGVHTSRYAGVGASDAERTNKLLTELSATVDSNRRARFVCVIAIYDSTTDNVQTFEGECQGRIALTPQGKHGFGYDPVFVPDGYSESFACLDAAIKLEISHRARALKAASDFLRQLSDGHA